MFNQQFQNFNQLLAHNYNSWHCNHHHNTFPSTLFAHHAHDFCFCSIYCYSYCVLCIIMQCSNILQLQYVFLLLVTHITISATILLLLLLLLLVWFVFWLLETTRRAANVGKCGLNSNACVVAALTSPQYRSRMLSIVCLFTILCLLVSVSVHVWRFFGLVGSIIRICCLPFCLFWCYYSIIIISFQLLLLHIVCDAWFRDRVCVCVVYAWECFWAVFCYLLHVFFIVSFTIIFFFFL